MTLIETMFSVTIGTLTIFGTAQAYVWCAQTAELSGYNLAAQQLAESKLEQTRATQWEPYNWQCKDALTASNFPPVVSTLDLPIGPMACPVLATSIVQIANIQGENFLRCITVECTWMLKGKLRTNTVASYRAGN